MNSKLKFIASSPSNDLLCSLISVSVPTNDMFKLQTVIIFKYLPTFPACSLRFPECCVNICFWPIWLLISNSWQQPGCEDTTVLCSILTITWTATSVIVSKTNIKKCDTQVAFKQYFRPMSFIVSHNGKKLYLALVCRRWKLFSINIRITYVSYPNQGCNKPLVFIVRASNSSTIHDHCVLESVILLHLFFFLISQPLCIVLILKLEYFSSIHVFSSTYQRFGCSCSSSSKVVQTSFSPAPFSSSPKEILKCSKAV